MMDFLSLTEQVSTIVRYFVPGYVFVTVWLFFTSRSIKHESYYLFACLIISVAIRMVDSSIYHLIPWFQNWNLNIYHKDLILVVTALGFSIIIAKISTSKRFGNLCSSVSNKSIHDSVFREIINYKGCSLIIECKDESIISGRLDCHEENGDNSLFAMKDYVIAKPKGEDGKYERNDSKGYKEKNSYIVVRLSDIKTIQVFNDSNTCELTKEKKDNETRAKRPGAHK